MNDTAEMNVDFGDLMTREERMARLAERAGQALVLWFFIGIAYGFLLGVIVVSATINDILK